MKSKSAMRTSAWLRNFLLQQLAIERGEDGLGHGVVVGIAHRPQRGLHARLPAPQVEGHRGARALLVLRDADDDCPKVTGPEAARWLANAKLPFPAAAVLFRREFETRFLPSLWRMAGRPLGDVRGVARPGIKPNARFSGDSEGRRDAKGVVSEHFASGRYKPSVDQLALTRLIDFGDLRQAGVPAFGTLERALRLLAQPPAAGAVYPPPA